MIIDFNKQAEELIKIEAKKTRDWAIKANNGSNDLVNWCTVCSYLIFKKLKKLNLEPEFCVVTSFFYSHAFYSHAFVYCQGYIVDVTATQFGIRKEVVVEKNNGKHKRGFWNLNDALRFKKIENIEKHLDESWDDCCNPKKKFRQKEEGGSKDYFIKATQKLNTEYNFGHYSGGKW